ncbi:MAG TPA: CRISPR-associated protein Cas4 [Acidilobales archaeon]|nr:MAG: CRISPR-associated protein Cas4 [Thermoprotei archaeon]HDD26876.1 CRISPR-associated protein Cas4 [Acidilobales archaeon]
MFNLVKDPDYVTAIDVKEYTYCPVIPWVMSNFMVTEPVSRSMEFGVVDVNYKVKVADELRLPKPRSYEVSVVSKSLRAAGRVDVIAGSRRVCIAEIKRYMRRRFKHFETQLKFYAYLVTKELRPVEKAYLVMGSKVIKYRVEYEDLKHIEKLIKEVREVKQSPTPPKHNPIPNQCANCWYRKYCPYT